MEQNAADLQGVQGQAQAQGGEAQAPGPLKLHNRMTKAECRRELGPKEGIRARKANQDESQKPSAIARPVSQKDCYSNPSNFAANVHGPPH